MRTAQQDAQAKAEIMARIRRAQDKLQRLEPPAGPKTVHDGSAPGVRRDYQRTSTHAPGSPEVIDVFRDALEDYNAQVQVVSSEQVPAAIVSALGSVPSVVVPPALPEAWLAALQAGPWQLRIDTPEKPLTTQELDQTAAVVSSARCAVSHTGTIMLDGQPDQGRRALSLLPDTHVVVVKASSVFPTVPQAVAVLAEHPERPTTWIAGPSATSDIELIRVDGVHGPRNLFVIIETVEQD